MVFINTTTSTGIILSYAVQNFGGSITALLIMIIIVLFALCFMFKMPIELTIPIVLPLIIYSMAYNSEILGIGGVALIYMALLFAKWFIV